MWLTYIKFQTWLHLSYVACVIEGPFRYWIELISIIKMANVTQHTLQRNWRRRNTTLLLAIKWSLSSDMQSNTFTKYTLILFDKWLWMYSSVDWLFKTRFFMCFLCCLNVCRASFFRFVCVCVKQLSYCSFEIPTFDCHVQNRFFYDNSGIE